MEQVFQECVLELKNKGKGIFLSSHILSEVERLCDRVGIIRDGKVVETGTLSELRHLTRSTMTIAAESPIEGLENMKGIFDILRKGDEVSFQIESGEVGNVISHAAKFNITKLESVPPSP
jgi:ABC-2 type transport system ATP-binding protein